MQPVSYDIFPSSWWDIVLGYYEKYHSLDALTTHSSEGWEIQDQGASDSVPDFQMAAFSLCFHTVGRASSLASSSSQDTSLIMKSLSSSKPSYLPSKYL